MIDLWRCSVDEDYKEYMLLCKEYVGSGDSEDIDSWENREYFFDTKAEMIGFVKSKPQFLLRVKAAFRLDKLSNNIFCE